MARMVAPNLPNDFYRGGWSAVYVKDQRGWTALANSNDFAQVSLAEARRGLEFARTISPRSSAETRAFFERFYGPRADPRAYADSFRIERVTTVFFGGPRASAELWNDSPHAAAVEWGNEANRRAHRVMARTAEFIART